MNTSLIKKSIKYINIVIILLIIIILLYIFSTPISNQLSSFRGDVEIINFSGEDSDVQFKAKGIYFIANETMFSSIKNIIIEKHDGKKRLINYSDSLQVQYNENIFQYLPNVEIKLYFRNLTLYKNSVTNKIDLQGYQSENAYNEMKSMGGEVRLLQGSVNYVYIEGEKFTDVQYVFFEMDNKSSIRYISKAIKLIAYNTSDLIIRSQWSKINISNGDGIFGINNKIFNIKNNDFLQVEILPSYKKQSYIYVDGTNLQFEGVINSAKSHDKNLIMNDFWYWLDTQPEKINAIAVVISLFLTAVASISTWRLVSMEAEKKKHEKQKFLNILLAEFETNSALLEDLRNSVDDIIKYPSKLITEFAFLGFKDDGFNAFRNQGGFQYIDLELYNKIINHYNLLYRIIKKLDADYLNDKQKRSLVQLYITKEIMNEIESIETLNTVSN